MGRKLRYIPEGGSLVEVTCRTVHSRFLLRPSAELNEIVAGVLGRAQRLYEMAICSYSFLSNHYHLLLDVKDAGQLMRFMAYLNSNLARETGRLHGWRDKIWSRRYEAIVISPEEPAQIERLRYVLANGCKEGLVGRPRDWPGVHAARDLMEGQALQGYWFSRTQEYAARRRGETFDRHKYATPETVVLSPLPCWSHFPAEDWRKLTLHLIHEIEEAAAAKVQGGKPAAGSFSHPRPTSSRSPRASKEIARPAVPRGERQDVQGPLGSLRLVRRDVPAGNFDMAIKYLPSSKKERLLPAKKTWRRPVFSNTSESKSNRSSSSTQTASSPRQSGSGTPSSKYPPEGSLFPLP